MGCSTTCGEGMQVRRVACRQELSESIAIPVAEELCTLDHDYVTKRKCFVKACKNSVEEFESTVSPVLATQGERDFRQLYQNSEVKKNFNYNEGYKIPANINEKADQFSARNNRK